MDYKVKRVLITGAAQGIGLSIAESLAKENISVIISDINEEAAIKSAMFLEKQFGCPTIGVKMDVADKQSVTRTVSQLTKKYGVIDGLVNNAGICNSARPLDEITEDEWKRVFTINVLGMVHCINAVIEGMRKQGYGKIVNMTSSSGFTGGISVSASYSVSKAGVMALTKNAANQFGPNGITVNAVSPGIIETEMTENLSYDKSGLALRRFGDKKEVSSLVAFLLSQGSDYMTGNIVDVNGGLYMR